MKGQPDFGMYAPKEVVASISDMGEVAARLGSIVIFDRRGDVVDFDNFESPAIVWDTAVLGDDSYVCLDSTHVRSESQSLRLHTENSAGAFANIDRAFQILASKRLGIEISFSLRHEYFELRFYCYYYDGEQYHRAWLKILTNERKIYVFDTIEGFVGVATYGDIALTPHVWNTIKLVFDINEAKYERLLFNNREYDISAYSLRPVDSEEGPFFRVQFWAINLNANGADVWLDDFILTQAEP